MPPASAEFKALHERRRDAFKRSEWAEVAAVCEAILAKQAKDSHAAHDLCVAHWRRNERDQARHWARRTCEAFLESQVMAPVEEQMTQMLALIKVKAASPRYLRHYEILGEILYEEGAFEAARDHFEQLTRIKGHFSRKYIYIFKCDLHLRDIPSARIQYRRMAAEFPGREGHLLVSCREYLGRHLDDNEALDLYIELLEASGMREREAQRLAEDIAARATHASTALLRAHKRYEKDTDAELLLVETSLQSDGENPALLLDHARLLLDSAPEKGARSLWRALQAAPVPTEITKKVVRFYLEHSPENLHENICKAILTFVAEDQARDWLLDLAAELPTNELLKKLKREWIGTASSVETAPGAITQMLDGLSLTDLIRAKMRMEEKISSAKKETTFLALDVVGSARLKEGVTPEKVALTFDEFHSLVDRTVKSHRGVSFIDQGDGRIVRFIRAGDAVRAARELRIRLDEFNKDLNTLGSPFQVRVGLHTGLSLIDENMNHRRVADRVLDVACHLEKYGEPGEIHLSEEVLQEARLTPEEITDLGWREKSGVRVYRLL